MQVLDGTLDPDLLVLRGQERFLLISKSIVLCGIQMLCIPGWKIPKNYMKRMHLPSRLHRVLV